MKQADQENPGSDLWLISPIKSTSVMSGDLDEGSLKIYFLKLQETKIFDCVDMLPFQL